MIKAAIFDLDGTLADTIEDLALTCDFVLKQFGRDTRWTLSDYRNFVGDGAEKLIDRAFEHSLNDDEIQKAYQMFQSKYHEVMLDHAAVYDGIVEALDVLRDMGIKLAVVTNKPHEAAVRMVESLFGKDCFDVIVGAKNGVPRKPEPHTTLIALKLLDCTAKEAIYFGDSDVDMKTARNAGVENVGCSWGYRSFAQLFAENPSIIIDEPCYIPNFFEISVDI